MTMQPSQLNFDNFPVMMNEKEVAAVLGVSVSKVRKDRARGEGIASCKIGTRVRYRRDKVIEYLISLYQTETLTSQKKG
ncbi:MAG: helix-turn-helix domain-containing protein [Rickettsiales bacterium]|nr:helix-turn-helix domain-containing protein [Rickettsiales bacterium]